MSVKYEDDFKEKVALEAIEVDNISATAKKHGVNVNSVRKWVQNFKKKLSVEKTTITDKRQDDSELIEVKAQLEEVQRELKEAMTLIGEKVHYINKLEKAYLNK